MRNIMIKYDKVNKQ